MLRTRSIDFCGISEHWLYKSSIHFVNSLNTEYRCHVICDSSLDLPSRRRVGKGGVGLMWKSKYDKYVTPLTLNDDRICGIQYQISRDSFLFLFQVYLPCRNHSIVHFKEYIDKLYDLWYMYSQLGIVIFMGDFNSNLLQRNVEKDTRNSAFSCFLRNTNLVAVNMLPTTQGARMSFVSYDGQHETLLDYILVPVEKADCVLHSEIADDNCLNVSRHRPVLSYLKLADAVAMTLPPVSSVSWKKVNSFHIEQYQCGLRNDASLQNAVITSIRNTGDIDLLCSTISSSVQSNGDIHFPKSNFKSHLKPYWNSDLTRLHKEMRTLRTKWKQHGRPRDPGNIHYNEYKNAKRRFRRLHREIVSKYLQSRDDEIDSACELDKSHFWKLVNARRKPSNSQAGAELCFDGIMYRDQSLITDQWKLYFERLYSKSENVNFNENWRQLVESQI